MKPEPTLAHDAVAGAPAALDRLVDAWLPTVLGWCIRMGGPTVNPEDAAQDVFEVVLGRIGGLRDPDAFPAWIYGITRKTLAGHRRRSWVRRQVFGLDLDHRQDPALSPVRRAEQGQTAHRVWTALAELPEAHREVLVLCDLEERADSEVATLLGVPRNTVKSRLRRARAALRERVPDLGPAPDDALPASDGGLASENS